MKKDKSIEYVNIPIYIEKAIKKLFKLKTNENELMAQIKDYMTTHGIPLDTPLQMLKYIPKEEVNPNQMQIAFETGEVNKND